VLFEARLIICPFFVSFARLIICPFNFLASIDVLRG
jgi:hypothetical protein